MLGVPRNALGDATFEQAFEDYYRKGLNSATLSAFGSLLGKLVAGELLGKQGTQRLLDHMRRINTGDRRIRAGLPEDADFVQKTGTQVRRACNVGTINPRRGARGAVVVVACAERFDALGEAENAFSRLGTALAQAGVLRPVAAADSPGASQ
jgi:beta-lactamase class A